MRVPLIAGNWKMHKTAAEAAAMVRALVPLVRDVTDVEIVIAPPFTALHAVGRELVGNRIRLGAQNMHQEDRGAYTGEVSAPMLVEAGVTYVILGHSERRQHAGESDALVAAKAARAIASGIIPILCVGETLEERERGAALETVERQVLGALGPLGASVPDNLVLAYEPVWAIGTGRTATASQAQEVHAHIRSVVATIGGDDRARRTRIVYGGSVNPTNAGSLMAEPDLDGALVGGASLDAEAFASIVQFRV